MQLAIMAHIPTLFGGIEGECIYVGTKKICLLCTLSHAIDTEGSFAVDRLVEMANAVLEHLQAQADSDEKKASLASVSIDSILDTIYCFRVHDYVQQIAIVSIFTCASLYTCLTR